MSSIFTETSSKASSKSKKKRLKAKKTENDQYNTVQHAREKVSLNALKIIDHDVETIVTTGLYTAVYYFRKSKWKRANIEGFLYLAKLYHPQSTYRLYVLNQLNTQDLVETITPHWSISCQKNFLFIDISPSDVKTHYSNSKSTRYYIPFTLGSRQIISIWFYDITIRKMVQRHLREIIEEVTRDLKDSTINLSLEDNTAYQEQDIGNDLNEVTRENDSDLKLQFVFQEESGNQVAISDSIKADESSTASPRQELNASLNYGDELKVQLQEQSSDAGNESSHSNVLSDRDVAGRDILNILKITKANNLHENFNNVALEESDESNEADMCEESLSINSNATPKLASYPWTEPQRSLSISDKATNSLQKDLLKNSKLRKDLYYNEKRLVANDCETRGIDRQEIACHTDERKEFASCSQNSELFMNSMPTKSVPQHEFTPQLINLPQQENISRTYASVTRAKKPSGLPKIDERDNAERFPVMRLSSEQSNEEILHQINTATPEIVFPTDNRHITISRSNLHGALVDAINSDEFQNIVWQQLLQRARKSGKYANI